MKTCLILLLIILSSCVFVNAQKTDCRFPLYKIGIKIQKPENYYLLTTEKVKEFKRNSFNNINVCNDSELTLENALKNPDYQIIVNENDLNDLIMFIKFPKTQIDKKIPEILQEKWKANCYSVKNTTITNLSVDNNGCKIGNYVSLLNRMTTPEITYYSEAFFIETRSSTIVITINSREKKSNREFINALVYTNSEQYERLLEETNEFIRKDEFLRAEKKILEAKKLEPSNVLAYEKMASINLMQKKFDLAMIDANEILKIDLSNINGYICKGLALHFLKDYYGAIKSFESAQLYYRMLFSLNAQNEYRSSITEIYRLMGESYLSVNNEKKGTENFMAALELSYDSLNTASIYYNLGLAKSTFLKDFTEAINYYSLAIQNYPLSESKKKSEAYYNRALNKRFVEDTKGAIIDYTQAIKIKPDYLKAYYNRGYAKLLLEDYSGAISDFTNTIKYDDNRTELTNMALVNRGIAKISSGVDGCPDLKKAKISGYKAVDKLFDKYCW